MNANLYLKPESFWIDLLRASVLAADVDLKTTRALLCHLSDLGVFRRMEATGFLELVRDDSAESGSQDIIPVLKERLSTLSQTSRGFAVAFFLSDFRPGEHPLPEFLTEEVPKASPETGIGRRTRTPSSDPSNLQIVRKVERQLKGFIALEEAFTRHLCGEHTGKAEARKLFNYALSKIQAKTKPRPWEQLSRRRHK